MDGTLCKEICWTPEDCLKATPIPKAIENVNKLFDTAFVIILTARKNNLMTASKDWLDTHHVKHHAISNFKMPFDQYVDADAIHPFDL